MSPMPQVLARLPLSDQCYTTWIVHRLLHNTSPPEPTTSGSLPPFPFLLAPFMLLFYPTQTLSTAFLYNSQRLFLHIYLCYLHSNKVAEIFHRGRGEGHSSPTPHPAQLPGSSPQETHASILLLYIVICSLTSSWTLHLLTFDNYISLSRHTA